MPINNKSSLELQGIAGRGGSLEVDGSRYSALELQGIAGRLKAGAFLKVLNSDTKSALECQGIAGRAGGGATVVFA